MARWGVAWWPGGRAATNADATARRPRRAAAPWSHPRSPRAARPGGRRHPGVGIQGQDLLLHVGRVAHVPHVRHVLPGVHEEQIVGVGVGALLLLHAAEQGEHVLAHRGGQRPQPPLVLGVSPPRVVQRRRGVQIEAGEGAHGRRRGTPRGGGPVRRQRPAVNDAMRSCRERTEWVRERERDDRVARRRRRRHGGQVRRAVHDGGAAHGVVVVLRLLAQGRVDEQAYVAADDVVHDVRTALVHLVHPLGGDAQPLQVLLGSLRGQDTESQIVETAAGWASPWPCRHRSP